MFKFGKITLVGKPNVGKSTLLNAMVGEKISIVSPKAQTTRDIIQGVVTRENFQMVFVDTPGIHKGKTHLSKYMAKGISTASSDVDVILYLIDGEKRLTDNIFDEIKSYQEGEIPVIVVITKLDRANKEQMIKDTFRLSELTNIKAIVPISVFRKKNMDVLESEILKLLDEGEPYFEEDYLTDKPMRFLVAERIREKTLYFYEDEIPHGISVEIAKFEFDEKKNMYDIYADIVCEKQTHKGIIIGKKGEALKKIATKSREDLERFMDAKVFLTLFVKVKEGWRDNKNLVNEFGYNQKDFD